MRLARDRRAEGAVRGHRTRLERETPPSSLLSLLLSRSNFNTSLFTYNYSPIRIMSTTTKSPKTTDKPKSAAEEKKPRAAPTHPKYEEMITVSNFTRLHQSTPADPPTLLPPYTSFGPSPLCNRSRSPPWPNKQEAIEKTGDKSGASRPAIKK